MRQLSPKTEQLGKRLMEWLPVVPLLVFVPLFLMTSLPRLMVPFELEWNEGHSAEQAWRFARGMPLYPSADEGWVPYMYAPLYHVIHGWIMWATGVWSLSWGRVISFVSTLSLLQGIALLVYHHSRRLVPAIAAALLYLAYYKPTGFWYDIVRVDSLAFALLVWGMYFTLKRHPRERDAVIGLSLLALATWAKQPNGIPAVACGLWILWRQPRASLIAGFFILLASANATFMFMRGDSEWFIKYVYTNAVNHPTTPHVYFPGYLHPMNFWKEAGNPNGLIGKFTAYLSMWWVEGPPTIWTDCLRHAWIVLLAFPAWMVMAIRGRQRPRGIILVVPCLIISVLGFVSLSKFGGYINNYQPVYIGVSIVFGLSLAGLMRAVRGVAWRAGVGAAVGVLLLLQVFQPWNMASSGNPELNWQLTQREIDPERKDALAELTSYLNERERAEEGDYELDRERPEVSLSVRLRHLVGRINHGGLTWFPSHQWPAEGSEAVYEDLLEWLHEKAQEKEPVLVLHHQWYGLLTGHPHTYNIDMLRTAHWAGDPIPSDFLNDLRNGRWPRLVMNSSRVEWEWLAGNVGDVIDEHYRHVGTVPAFEGEKNTLAMMPVTGASMRPIELWVHRSFVQEAPDKDPDIAPSNDALPEIIPRYDVESILKRL